MNRPLKNLSVVVSFVGSLLMILGLFLLIPLLLVFLFGEYGQSPLTFQAFLIAAGVAFGLGIIFKILFKQRPPNIVQAIFICSFGWIIISAVGAIPFLVALKTNYLNAYFETMSGFTTTGITMFTGLDQMPRSILFWRSLIQWIGGLGILTFFLAITSQSGGAHRLFGAESHKIDVERPVPGLGNTIKILWTIYIAFTLFIILSLKVAGCSIFDSICHSFTALSTGGFSPYDASIAHYQMIGHPHYKLIEYILILGMFLGGTNFIIHYRVLRGEFRSAFDTTEMRFWIGFIVVFTLLILGERYLRIIQPGQISLVDASFWKTLEYNFRNVLFQVLSILTTTGFGTQDIASPFFGTMARQLFLVMMVIGGCVGSTGGGIKVLRISILVKLVKREIFKLFAPSRAISYVKLNKKSLHSDEIYRVSALFFAWIALLLIGGIITALFSKYDGYRSISGMFSALGNIGPCYIPVAEMGQLHPVIKITYIVGMLAGRLEILPVLLIFSPRAWRS